MRFLILLLAVYSQNILAWNSKDFKEELISPVTTDARWALYSGALITLTFAVFEDQIDKAHNEVVEDKPLGKFSTLGDLSGQMLPNGLYMIYQWSFGESRRAQGMFKATMYASGATTVLKYSIREPRPNNHADRNSFPSGHTTTAAAFASYIAAEHGWPYGIPAGVLAGFVGLSRINDNKHRLHDVAAGATIGAAYGWGIQQKDRQKLKGQGAWAFIPVVDTRTLAFSFFSEF